jgi:hypothetical protein
MVVAAQPAAWSFLFPLLEEKLELVPVHTRADAMQLLDYEGGRIDLILCTVAFDDSHMVEFLQSIKADPEYSRIPFLSVRIFPTVLSDHLVDGMRQVCKEFGAVDLLDVARMPREKAQQALRTAVDDCLGSARASRH